MEKYITYIWLFPAQYVYFLYARSHLWESQNRHAIISTRILKVFIFE